MKLEELEIKSDNIDLDKYIEFREDVKSRMEHPEWLGDFTKEDLKELLKNGSKIWVFYINNEEVCSTMAIPARKKDMDKFDLNIDFKKTIDYGPTFVNDKFRGNKLQLQMTKFLDDFYINKGYEYAVSTIHPDNIYSINNLLGDDFKKVGFKELKRGPRNIYSKKLKK